MAISDWNACHGHPGRALGHDKEALQAQMWTDGPIKWQRCASAWTRSAAGRFALIKASRRFLCSSRGPLDVKRLKAGSRGRRMAQKHKCEDRTFYELDDSEDDRVFSV